MMLCARLKTTAHVKMALNTSHECECDDTIEFLTFDYSKRATHLCDIDLTCYECFYDSSSEVASGDIKDHVSCTSKKCGLECLEMFARNETNACIAYSVPDVDSTWPDGDDDVHDVLRLYNIVKGELFSPHDITNCLLCGRGPPVVQTYSLGLQQVPTLIDNICATETVQPCLSPCTPETGSQSELASQSPAHSTESDSQDDARVPSSCRQDVHPSGLYYIEE